MAISQQTRQILRKSSSITPTTSAVPRTSPTLRPISPSSMPTCHGELLVDEHTSSEDMPYKFNGKELDQETGQYYYGQGI